MDKPRKKAVSSSRSRVALSILGAIVFVSFEAVACILFCDSETTITSSRRELSDTTSDFVLGAESFPGAVPNSLDLLLDFLGYEDTRFRALEAVSPLQQASSTQELPQSNTLVPADKAGMEPHVESADILGTRYFSPLTSTLFNGYLSQKEYGWRRVVRLKVRANSMGARLGFKVVYFLGNIISADLSIDPLSAHSAFNNVIFVQSAPDDERRYAMYFAIYHSVDKGGNILSIRASSPNSNKEMRILTCIDCHGGDYRKPALICLDTDDWLDRSRDDFVEVSSSAWGALYDCGKSIETIEFERGFAAIRAINQEIFDINNKTAPRSLASMAVKTWLESHAQSTEHIPAIERRFSTNKEYAEWGKDSNSEMWLTETMSRYCHKCHYTFLFNAYDKSSVIANLDEIIARLQIDRSRGGMPRDRDLDPVLRQQLIHQLESLRH